jgi:hypothetical protein
MSKPPEIEAALPTLRAHLRELVESPAFKGSRRGQQFLQHVVEKALSGHSDELKERSLGVELFGRDPSYDTGEDAIVRVTASDVRKRLHQFYSETASELRIELCSGSYVPEFHRVTKPAEAKTAAPRWRASSRWPLIGACLLVASLLTGLWIRYAKAGPTIRNTAPWSYLFREGKQPVLVLSDPDISAVQLVTGSRVSLSDYANGKYLPNPAQSTPDLLQALQHFRGANVPTVDVAIAMNIAGLAVSRSASLKTRPARSLKLSDFKTDDDFILLGSPRSNPWIGLFEDRLDFHFLFDEEENQEILRNRRPRAGEAERYVPTARGWDTGHAFAIVALVQNPNQGGHALLLAGTNAEGTEASGKLATNPAALARVLERCGVDPTGRPHQFEILLEVRTMAGSPNTFDVKTCHGLEAPPPA